MEFNSKILGAGKVEFKRRQFMFWNQGVETVDQSKFSMGFVLAIAAKYTEDQELQNSRNADYDRNDLLEFKDRLKQGLDEEIDAAFPKEWVAIVCGTTKDCSKLEKKV